MSLGVAERDQRRARAADAVGEEITDWDRRAYLKIISTELSDDQIARIVEPQTLHPRQEAVLAVHWHPEFIPPDLIRRRLDAMFPNRSQELIIPTQHNILVDYDGYSGVEVDCFSRSFNRKVQLLVHFRTERVAQATVFRSMLERTFRYRARQLFEFIDTLVDDAYEDRLQKAADRAGADENLVRFVRVHAAKLYRLFLEFESKTPPVAIRNKILVHYFETLRSRFDPRMVNHAEMLLQAVKETVKHHFSNEFFYATEEVIEEVRGLGGSIVVPHPEQFWPILLAEYDVDGYEVWNPQSQEFTEFLIQVVGRQNKARKRGDNPILIFMGDDCHMGEKAKDPEFQDPEKVGREVGVQPAWDDLAIRKSLIVAGADRRTVIDDYKARLGA
ncbi:MAG: hypothetical protein HOP29_17820 [Phycisphaerales bacterium]|nr:hypothetical protein [Phycisphaerales bacterium]